MSVSPGIGKEVSAFPKIGSKGGVGSVPFHPIEENKGVGAFPLSVSPSIGGEGGCA